MLRTGVLSGRTIVLAGASDALRGHLEGLEATLGSGAAPGGGAGPGLTLVVDARGDFGDGGYEGVRAAVDRAFAAVRDVAAAHWIDTDTRGQAILVAPAPGAGRHAGAARAGLENLVRSLATEWARHGVTTVAILPADATPEATLHDLVAWLATPAGAYVSGTALTLTA